MKKLGTSIGLRHAQAIRKIARNLAASVSLTLMASAALAQQLSPPVLTKTFQPATVLPLTLTRMTLTLSNPNDATLTNLSFTDNYPPGLQSTMNDPEIACTPGGLYSFGAGFNQVVLGTGALPGHGQCTFAVLVRGAQLGTLTNVTSTVTSAESAPGAAGIAALQVVASIAVPTLNTAAVCTLLALVVCAAGQLLRKRSDDA
jgi:hypothetical protein